MNFRKWLVMAEDRQDNKLEPDWMHGGHRRAMPLSWLVDNKPVRSVLKGIGDGRAKIRAAMGVDPSDEVSFEPLQDDRRESMQSLYMPLQLPEGHETGDVPRYFNKSLIMYARSVSQDPIKDPRIYNVDETNANIKDIRKIDPESMKTKLYSFWRNEPISPNDHDYAVNFTQALMMASLIAKMSKYSHLLDLERPKIAMRKIIPVRSRNTGDYGENDRAEFNEIMLCSFVFEPRSKDVRIGRDVYDDIDSMIRDRSPRPERGSQGISSSDARRSLDALSGTRGSDGRTSQMQNKGGSPK